MTGDSEPEKLVSGKEELNELGCWDSNNQYRRPYVIKYIHFVGSYDFLVSTLTCLLNIVDFSISEVDYIDAPTPYMMGPHPGDDTYGLMMAGASSVLGFK
ncbi:Hypothetical predicted protein [Olea europaea subsp. europaea]|uniref:Uncharacterized protein n=1 Tax=Olea europaea subsp. europaea TaxID=158383 RepID=A0A8S0SP76_OLEEU|nr:Hypothetical predicted protein [Olea europaea subsp. europaea]